ncbi:MAG: helix-turn-helix domain-containing protein [Actinobacteria bacterium]|nr:helix-turn-helix domain-containing protein [Actinomycetota bacterium]
MVDSFGDYVERKRKQKGMSLRELAKEVGISASYLSDIEKGRRYAPDKKKLDHIAALIDIEGEELDKLYDLAGETKDNVAPDLNKFISKDEKARVLLRKVRDKKPSPETLNKIMEILDKEK